MLPLCLIFHVQSVSPQALSPLSPESFLNLPSSLCLVSTIIYATPVHTWANLIAWLVFLPLHHLFFLHQLVLNTYSQIDTRADDNSLNCLTRSFQDLDLALSPVLSLITIPTNYFLLSTTDPLAKLNCFHISTYTRWCPVCSLAHAASSDFLHGSSFLLTCTHPQDSVYTPFLKEAPPVCPHRLVGWLIFFVWGGALPMCSLGMGDCPLSHCVMTPSWMWNELLHSRAYRGLFDINSLGPHVGPGLACCCFLVNICEMNKWMNKWMTYGCDYPSLIIPCKTIQSRVTDFMS